MSQRGVHPRPPGDCLPAAAAAAHKNLPPPETTRHQAAQPDQRRAAGESARSAYYSTAPPPTTTPGWLRTLRQSEGYPPPLPKNKRGSCSLSARGLLLLLPRIPGRRLRPQTAGRRSRCPSCDPLLARGRRRKTPRPRRLGRLSSHLHGARVPRRGLRPQLGCREPSARRLPGSLETLLPLLQIADRLMARDPATSSRGKNPPPGRPRRPPAAPLPEKPHRRAAHRFFGNRAQRRGPG